MNYSIDEIKAKFAAGEINAIKFTYLIETDSTTTVYNDVSSTVFYQAGYKSSTTPLTINKWQDIVLPLTDAVLSSGFYNYRELRVTRIRYTAANTSYLNFYLGDLEFVNLEDTTHTPYEGSYSLKFDLMSTMPTTGWKNSASGSFGAKTTTYVSPDEVNAIENIKTASWSDGEYVNTHGAIKFTSVTNANNNYLGLQLPHTKAQYLALKDTYGVNAIKFTYAIETDLSGVMNWSFSTDTKSILAAAGYYGSGEPTQERPYGTQLPLNSWQTEILSIDDVMNGAMQKDPWLFVASLSRVTSCSADHPITLYVADFEIATVEESEFTTNKMKLEYLFEAGFNRTGMAMETHSASYSQTYVSPEELADFVTNGRVVNDTTTLTISNPTGYTGGAVRLGDLSSTAFKGNQTSVGVASPWTQAQYIALYDAGAFDGITATVNIMIASSTATLSRNAGTREFSKETDDWSRFSLFSAAGYRTYERWDAENGVPVPTNHTLDIPTNQWVQVTVKLDDPYFRNAIKTSGAVALNVFTENGISCEMYFGDIVVNYPSAN